MALLAPVKSWGMPIYETRARDLAEILGRESKTPAPETAPAAKEDPKPAPVTPPALPLPSNVVFLSDLPETEVRTTALAPALFGKGRFAGNGLVIQVNGVPSPHGLARSV